MLAWLYVKGEWSKGNILPIDGDIKNQSWSNLFDSGAVENKKTFDLTCDELRSILSYDPVTGEFRRKNGESIEHLIYEGASSLKIAIKGKHNAGDLAWLYIHGEWPKAFVSYKDGNHCNNAIDNINWSINNKEKQTIQICQRQHNGS